MAAKIQRAQQKQFASLAAFNQLSQFGSLAAGTPVRYDGATVTAANVQNLSNFLDGWFGGVIGANAPTIEDMNSLFWLTFYQIGYILQTGVAEWNNNTEYFIGSLVNDGFGHLYVSLTDNNLGNPLTDLANWQIANSSIRTLTGTGNILVTDDYVRGDATAGAFVATLPALASVPNGKRITYKNVSTNGNQTTLQGNGAELIDGANTLVLDSDPVLDSVTVIKTATRWEIL